MASNERLTITFLGTGTSHGVPMIGCRCATCQSTDPRDRRWRPSVSVALPSGTVLLVDASPDLREQALRFSVSRVDAILFTHSHADHVLGLDDVRRFNALKGSAMPCYGDEQTLADVRRIFAYAFDPTTPKGGGLPELVLFTLTGEFGIDGAILHPVPIRHGARPVVGYRIGGFAYLTDCSGIPDTSWPILEGLDVLVLGALRRRPHPSHFSVDQAVDAASRIGAAHTYFTHMCHDLPHAATNVSLPARMELAYDGLVVTARCER